MKRYLYLWHRWLGIALCLFMALWFVSGVVMLYVGYPKLTPREHLAPLPELTAAGCCIDPAQALAASGMSEAPTSLRLTSVAGEPRYLLAYPGQPEVAVNALSGARISAVDREAALTSAQAFAGGVAARYRGLVDEDMWSHSRALSAERPFHVVDVDDAQQRRLYISSHTGRVWLDATARERAWNWLGAWLHWLYPLRGGLFDGWAADIVIYLSLAATAMALLGQVVGILRWRFSRPYRSGSRSPYAGGFARWHHIAGLLFGTLLIAWIFSGLMSMRPWHLLDSRSTLSAADLRGADLRAENLPYSVQDSLVRLRQSGLRVSELEWRMLGGQAYVVGLARTGDSRILPLDVPGSPALPLLPADTLLRAAHAMQPAGHLQTHWLEHYDDYHYARAEQSMNGSLSKRLPVLQVRFDDEAATWIYLDPYSGALVDQLDQRRRAARWLFNLLHSWDWLPLLERPLLRETLIIAASLGGLVISLSGAVLGWRRLRRPRIRTERRSSPACSPLQGENP